jgi:glycosyltransferase involved in cell wall biosynthesis
MRILYLYPHSMDGEHRTVMAGRAPTDRMYGLVELRQYGHDVRFADSRFRGRFGRVSKRLRGFGVNLCDLRTLLALGDYDVVVAKDAFSTMLTLSSRPRRAKVVYVDSLFEPPARAWKNALIRLNLRFADGVVAYSRTQIAAWAERYKVRPSRFQFLPYTLDVPFYRALASPPATGTPYVLSIGRDMGRRFDTLAEALAGLGLDLKLVTLPYLLNSVDTTRPGIEVLQHVSYEELFRLYARALMVVIPLKRGITYPSGVRGMLEAMALGSPVISSRTPVLEEYATEGEGVTYVDPEDVGQLRERIVALRDDTDMRERLAERGRQVVSERFGMEAFARGLEAYLGRVVRSSTAPQATETPDEVGFGSGLRQAAQDDLPAAADREPGRSRA